MNRILSKDALLASFVSAFLDFVKDGGYVAEEGLLVTLSCKKLEIVLTLVLGRSSLRNIQLNLSHRMARKILNSQQCGWFIPVVRVLATGLVSLAFIASHLLKGTIRICG